MQRTLATHTPNFLNTQVLLQGWVASIRDHGGLIFIDLRDHTGLVQLTVHPNNENIFTKAEKLRDESVITVTGQIIERDPKLINPNLITGKIEVIVDTLIILNSAKPLPFPIYHQTDEISEDLRLKYRFLDLRREKMQSMLLFRHKMIKYIRDWMDARGFIEIQTPILTSSSPEGARDFLVPSRLHPGKFYALPQAPQQFKQLLMVAGVPKYFQIAPCMRDEDARADRSPGEFYQLDLEIAFAEEDETVFQELEPLFIKLTEEFAGKKMKSKPIPRIPYQVAMDTYGSDKPDLRFGMELINLSSELQNTEFSVFQNVLKQGGVVKAIRLQDGGKLSRSQIDDLTEFIKKEGAKGLAYIVFEEDGLKSPILKFLSQTEIQTILSKTQAEKGDIIFFGADSKDTVNKTLGKLRDKLAADFGLKDPNIIAWAWITDFPMYEWNEREQKIDFMHNPFSMPQGGLEALNSQDPLAIKAYQYDIVANGLELSSGAIRNYNPDIMYKAFEIVGHSKTEVDAKFGAMIRAFEYGAPPHGGFAPGIERLLMVLSGETSIREVVPFPKNGNAEDLMMNAPSEVNDKQLKELHIKLNLPINTKTKA